MFSTSGRGHLKDKPASSACFSHSHAQVKANTGRARSPHLIGTARFASIKGHLGVGKCDILHSGCLKHRCDDLGALAGLGLSNLNLHLVVATWHGSIVIVYGVWKEALLSAECMYVQLCIQQSFSPNLLTLSVASLRDTPAITALETS
ncbi:hypothetical protein ABVK25_002975 [Lepraria finkii]|uniref:Uncharacterized protein n=1 Tax=Lepraria finkii TaxID=1340010 RepID=A0ABR4BIC1_9LECA